MQTGDFHQDHTRHVRAFAELLIVLRRDFRPDLDMVLILSVIAERHYARCDAEARVAEAWAGGGTPSGLANRYEINAHSVSLYAAIPRETVRRKVRALVAHGWLAADDKGHLRPTARAVHDLGAATAATRRYLAALAER